jgi:pimeloyl-ACP methyl ester carboxylesterase
MHIHESGPRDAPAIVFLHGSGATADLWRYHVQYFAAWHCLVPEFPGFGDSADQPWVSVQATAAELASIIGDRLSGKTHVVGISVGGAVAMTLLADCPDLIDHAVIDGAGVLPIAGAWRYRIGVRLVAPFLKTDFVTAAIVRALGYPEGSVDGLRRNFRRMHAASFVHAVRDTLNFREPAGLAEAPCPTLFVAGAREPEATRASNAYLAGAMPHAAARIVPGVHHGWIANDPALHCRMVEAWITGRPLPKELVPA